MSSASPEDGDDGLKLAWTIIPIGRRLAVEDGWTHTRFGRQAVDSASFASQAFEYSIELRHLAFSSAEAFAPPSGIGAVYEHLSGRFEAECRPDLTMRHNLDAVLAGMVSGAPTNEATYAIVCVACSGWLQDELTAANTAFDAALDVVNQLLLAFSLLTDAGDGPVSSVRSEDIPHALPVVAGGVLRAPNCFGAAGVVWILPRRMRVVHRGQSVTRVVTPTDLDDAMVQLDAGASFLGYIDTRRDALEQLHSRGDRRLAALLAGVAGEVMLDTLLLHLMWEEQSEPRLSSGVFDTIFKSRILSEYHGRLGGDWSGATGPVGAYIERVLHLRNRVAHAAYAPDFDEAAEAIAALLALERWIGDRLASDEVRNKYPRTAITWAGRRGLERRQKHTNRIRTIASDEAEPGWSRAFAVWRFHFFSARGAYPPPPTGNIVLLVDAQTDAVRYVLLDVSAQFAVEVQEPRPFVEDAQFQSLDWLVATLRNANAPRSWAQAQTSSSVDWKSCDLAWRPAYEVLEACSYELPSSRTDR